MNESQTAEKRKIKCTYLYLYKYIPYEWKTFKPVTEGWVGSGGGGEWGDIFCT